MSEQPNLAGNARRTLELFERGEAEALAALYTEEGVMHVAGNNRISGTFRGRAEIANALTNMFQLVGSTGTMRIEPAEAILASDDHVMFFFHAVGQRDGKSLDATFVMAAKSGPEGRWQELWFLGDDQTAYDRFWS